MPLSSEQRRRWLNLILRNRNLYGSFLVFAESRFVGESVRFLHDLRCVPWNGMTPLSAQTYAEGLWATYLKEGSFFQVNLSDQLRTSLKQAVHDGQTPESGESQGWDQASAEVEDLLVSEMNNNVIDAWLEKQMQTRAVTA